jgi:hypothetical protein
VIEGFGMDSRSLWQPGWLRTVVAVGILSVVVPCHLPEVRAQTSSKTQSTDAKTSAVHDVRSAHFLIHTDLPSDETDALVERLEALLRHVTRYWGQPMRTTIECYVILDPGVFPAATIASVGGRGVKTAGGVTLMNVNKEDGRRVAKSVVYAAARLEVAQHETVHAYCHQTFGRVGPVWYSEGMAEIGRFWNRGDAALHAEPREIEFLRNNPPKSLADTLSPSQVTGDSWQNYASRWALCHFLVFNPNYSHQFRRLGCGLLAGKDVSFERTFAATNRELFLEYSLFLRNICQGYRVDLCTWNWKKDFVRLQPERATSVTIVAGRGWQPTGLTVCPGAQHDYLATGTWQIAEKSEPVDADGDQDGNGRLVGALLKDYRLGPEFDLGINGSLPSDANGDLYLRCRNSWNRLAGDRGAVTVRFQCQEEDAAPCDPGDEGRVGRQEACGSAHGNR